MRPILWLMLFLAAAGGVYSLGSFLAKREAPLHADDPRLLTGDAKIVIPAKAGIQDVCFAAPSSG